MHNAMNMHTCRSIEIVYHKPTNRNCVAIRVAQDGGSTDIVFFDLPAAVTARLMAAFGVRDPKVVSLERRDNVSAETGK